jgi:hypothetical protein
LEGPRELTASYSQDYDEQLVTANVEVGGADGVKAGYFEVELTEDEDSEEMFFYVGMFRPNLDHENKVYGQGDGWVLDAKPGGFYNLNADDGVIDEQGKLKVGDRVGVLVDLEEKEGRQGGSIRFFVNGVQFGSGFESGMTGPLVLGVLMCEQGQKVTLLPDAQRPADF